MSEKVIAYGTLNGVLHLFTSADELRDWMMDSQCDWSRVGWADGAEWHTKSGREAIRKIVAYATLNGALHLFSTPEEFRAWWDANPHWSRAGWVDGAEWHGRDTEGCDDGVIEWSYKDSSRNYWKLRATPQGKTPEGDQLWRYKLYTSDTGSRPWLLVWDHYEEILSSDHPRIEDILSDYASHSTNLALMWSTSESRNRSPQ